MNSLSHRLLLLTRLFFVTSGWLVSNKHCIWHLFLQLRLVIAISTTTFPLILIWLIIVYNSIIDLILITLRIIIIVFHVYTFNLFSWAATIFCLWDRGRRLTLSLWRFWVFMLLHLLLEGALVWFAAIDFTATTVYEDGRGANFLLYLFRACIGRFTAFVCGKILRIACRKIFVLFIWVCLVRRPDFRTATSHSPVVPFLSLSSIMFLTEWVLILFFAVFLTIWIILVGGALLEHFEHQFTDRFRLKSLLNDILVL